LFKRAPGVRPYGSAMFGITTSYSTGLPALERIALAHRTGPALPPITLDRRPDGHSVIDGCHRVSVARALGHRDIEAWVRHAGSSR
jgi:hypothetical protein